MAYMESDFDIEGFVFYLIWYNVGKVGDPEYRPDLLYPITGQLLEFI